MRTTRPTTTPLTRPEALAALAKISKLMKQQKETSTRLLRDAYRVRAYYTDHADELDEDDSEHLIDLIANLEEDRAEWTDQDKYPLYESEVNA